MICSANAFWERSKAATVASCMVVQTTKADIEWAIAIAADQVPGIEKMPEMSARVALAIAQGIAEGRVQGFGASFRQPGAV
jgi:hypothetical protein